MSHSKLIRARSNRVQENPVKSDGSGSPKAVIFARAVCAEHANERIAAQLKSCGDYAASHRIEVLREFTSVGRAGREEFGAMLNFVKKNCDCRMIIVGENRPFVSQSVRFRSSRRLSGAARG